MADTPVTAGTATGGRAPASPQWQAGDLVLGTYRVVGLIGEGGMGKVYEVLHTGWNIKLAVKTIRPEILQTTGAEQLFIREAETWINLGLHPHVVSCYYVRLVDGLHRVFVEHVGGGSLSDWIRSMRLYDGGHHQALERILDIAIQFAWALHFAHGQGLVHRDVKPSNVMITSDGATKLTDFGLMAAYEEAGREPVPMQVQPTRSNRPLMTPRYCSPEQYARLPLSPKTDMWSWAVSILEMFCGEPPVPVGHVADAALGSIASSEPEYDYLPRIPPSVLEMLTACLSRNPFERPADMLAIADRLRETYSQITEQPYKREYPKYTPEMADSLNNRALSLLDLGKREEAEKTLSRAIEVESQHPEATYNRGLLLWRSGRLTDTDLINEMENIYSSRKGHWASAYLHGQVSLEAGEYVSSARLFREALDSTDDEGLVRDALGMAEARIASSKRVLQSLSGHREEVNSVTFSPDGSFLVSGGGDGTLRLWETETGRCLRVLQDRTKKVTCVRLSSDGTRAVSIGGEGTGGGLILGAIASLEGGTPEDFIAVWNLVTGERLQTLDGHTAGNTSLSLSGDGRLLASGGDDNTTDLWDLRSGSFLRTLKGHGRSMTWGNLRLSFRWWDPFVRMFINLSGVVDGSVQSVCLTDDGRYLLSGGMDGRVVMWETQSGRRIRTFRGHEGTVMSIALVPGKNLALSGSEDSTLRLWDMSTGECVRVLAGHSAGVNSVWVSSDGSLALSGSNDQKARLWSLDKGRCIRTLDEARMVMTVALSPDNKQALTAGWRFETNANRVAFEPRLWHLDCANIYEAPFVLTRVPTSEASLRAENTYRKGIEDARGAVGNREFEAARGILTQARSQQGCSRRGDAFKLWTSLYKHMFRSEIVSVWGAGKLAGHRDRGWSLRMVPDAEQVLSSSHDGALRLWDLDSLDCVRVFSGPKEKVSSISISQDGRVAITASEDNTLRVWDFPTGKYKKTLQKLRKGRGSVASAPFIRGGRYALSVGWGYSKRERRGSRKLCEPDISPQDPSDEYYIRKWDLATGRWDYTLELPGRPLISYDGCTAVIATGTGDFLIVDTESGSLVRTVASDRGEQQAVCINRCGHRIALRTQTEHLRVCDLITGEHVSTLDHGNYVSCACFDPGGLYIVTGDLDGSIKFWEVLSGRCIQQIHAHDSTVEWMSFTDDAKYLVSSGTNDMINICIVDWQLTPAVGETSVLM